MFAVRNIFSRPERLRTTIRDLVAAGELPQSLATMPEPLGFLIHEGGASTIPDAAYRFVRHEPGVDVVLFGTGNSEHLRTNIASILKPPLPEPDRQQLAALFGHLVGVGWTRRTFLDLAHRREALGKEACAHHMRGALFNAIVIVILDLGCGTDRFCELLGAAVRRPGALRCATKIGHRGDRASRADLQ